MDQDELAGKEVGVVVMRDAVSQDPLVVALPSDSGQLFQVLGVVLEDFLEEAPVVGQIRLGA